MLLNSLRKWVKGSDAGGTRDESVAPLPPHAVSTTHFPRLASTALIQVSPIPSCAIG